MEEIVFIFNNYADTFNVTATTAISSTRNVFEQGSFAILLPIKPYNNSSSSTATTTSKIFLPSSGVSV